MMAAKTTRHLESLNFYFFQAILMNKKLSAVARLTFSQEMRVALCKPLGQGSILTRRKMDLVKQ